jgi:glycogen operon protein
VHTDGTTDLAWFAQDGTLMDHDRWQAPSLRTLAMFLHGEPVRSDSVLVLVQGHHEPVEVTLPGAPWASRWDLLWDSGVERPDALGLVSALPGEAVAVAARTVRLYRACL